MRIDLSLDHLSLYQLILNGNNKLSLSLFARSSRMVRACLISCIRRVWPFFFIPICRPLSEIYWVQTFLSLLTQTPVLIETITAWIKFFFPKIKLTNYRIFFFKQNPTDTITSFWFTLKIGHIDLLPLIVIHYFI